MKAVMRQSERAIGSQSMEKAAYLGPHLLVRLPYTQAFARNHVVIVAIVEEIMRPVGTLPKRIVQVRITEAIVELARAGQGIAILSGWSFYDLDNRAGLVPVRVTRGGFRRRWRAVVRDDCRDEHVASFVRTVREVGKAMRAESWRRDLQDVSRNKQRLSA